MRLGERTLRQSSLFLGKSDALPEYLKAVIEVSSVFTPKEERKKGYADALMARIVAEADAEKVVLMLMPDGFDWLEAWYEKHGFKRIQDYPVLMARPFKND